MKPIDQTYTREALIGICERACVPESEWRNRDSEQAQRQVGECLMLLKAGCAFTIDPDTDDETIWVEITSKGFNWFEISEMRVDTRYLPTEKRLTERAGLDWYR